jgi:MoxR-like ATPase
MRNLIEGLSANIGRVFLGNAAAVERVVCCLLARGHLLIEDVPGVGKTLLGGALARSLDCSFVRLQLTPDMLPSDVLGVSILDKQSGEFTFKRGPIFANIVLADEINRTTPRTQSALLEAMNEASVSIDGRTYELERPFMVIATQNPTEFEGTYVLPENQLDRFLMRIELGYPTPEQEARVLEQRPAQRTLPDLQRVLTRAQVIDLQERVDGVTIRPAVLNYIVALAQATRKHADLHLGLSPRGTLALAQAARATAFIRDRDYVIPEDVIDNLIAVGAHRVVPRHHEGGAGQTMQKQAERTLDEIRRAVPNPA